MFYEDVTTPTRHSPPKLLKLKLHFFKVESGWKNCCTLNREVQMVLMTINEKNSIRLRRQLRGGYWPRWKLCGWL